MAHDRRTIRDRYDDLGAELYDVRYTEEQRRKHDAALQEVRIDEGSLVLDNGCGTGLLLELVEACSVGLDISSRLLSKARERARGNPLVHLINGDSEYLPVRSKVFHFVLSFTVIQNASSPVRMLDEMKSVKREAGVTAVTTLKKAFSKQELIELFGKSQLKINRFVDSKNTNDWMIIAE